MRALKKYLISLIYICLSLCILAGCGKSVPNEIADVEKTTSSGESSDTGSDLAKSGSSGTGDASSCSKYAGIAEIPSYSGSPCVEINGNVPFFDKDELSAEAFAPCPIAVAVVVAAEFVPIAIPLSPVEAAP